MTTIDWHRLIDGDPETTGRYIVAHKSMAQLAIYTKPHRARAAGWNKDVSAFTHWAKEPCAPDDGTPQLFRAEGRRLRAEALEAASWDALTTAGGSGDA